MSKFFAVTVMVLLLTTGAAGAQANGAHEGVASNGLCGLVLTGYPVCAQHLNLSASAGYGYTESIGAVDGAHHRANGVLAAGIAPLPWLSLALRLDGRLDLHPKDDRGKDLTGTGDPRIYLRAGRAFAHGLSAGGEAVLWLPGGDAPSFEPAATTVDLKALLAWRSEGLPLTLLAHVGMRLDQSAKSAPDLARLRSGDLIALGLSDSHAVLLALGGAYDVHPLGQVFAELALDVLVGADAPKFGSSPMRGSLGGRAFLSPALALELTTTIAFQQRPSVAATDPLVPIEPRFSFAMGVRYAFDLHPAEPEPVAAPIEQPKEPEPTTATVTGALLDDHGAPLPDVRVVLRSGELSRETVSDAEGRYTFTDVPVGPATLESSATGFESARWELDVRPHLAPLEARAMSAKSNAGTLRILARTFSSEPLTASIQVRDTRGRKVAVEQTDAQGRYELELPPGDYVVMISATGYRPHRREVRIERYGVAILNVDLSAEK